MAATDEQQVDKWVSLGIRFVVATPADAERVLAFLDTEFFLEEPIMLSLCMARNETWTDKLLRAEWKRSTLHKVLKEPTSIMALDKESKIVGKCLVKIKCQRKWEILLHSIGSV